MDASYMSQCIVVVWDAYVYRAGQDLTLLIV